MPTKASQSVEKTLPPDQRPLPELPVELAHELNIAVADAQLLLYPALEKCWAAHFKKAIIIEGRKPIVHFTPELFFKPFVEYAVAIYEAYARVLLKLRPSFPDFEAWLNYALKTLICEQLCPTDRRELPLRRCAIGRRVNGS
jgi:hypothetical protein